MEDIYYRYMYARARFRKGDFDPSGPIDEGVFIDRIASPPIVTADHSDPDFHAAIYWRDDAIEIEPEELAQYRKYVTEAGPFPRRRDVEADEEDL